MTEISDRYERLADDFARTVSEVPEDRWSSPSPCDGWTALDVVRHVVDTQSMFLGLVGRDAGPVPLVDGNPDAAWATASAAVLADLTDPERAGAEFDGFFGRTSFEQAVDRFVSFDLVVHRWDLARAVGGDEHIDPADARSVIDGAAVFGDALHGPGVCGPALQVGRDADVQTQMLGLLGRRS